MKRTTGLRVAIALLLLGAAACVLVGKSVIRGPGFSLSYPYIGALFPTADSSFRSSTTIYVWLLLAGGVAGALLVWIKSAWAALAVGAISLSSPVYHVIRSIQNGYSPLQIDGLWEFLMLALPLAAAALCFTLFRAARAKAEEPPEPAKAEEPPEPAKAEEPPEPAPKTKLGEHLKQRFIEFDIHGSAEQLTPYFEEALAALRDHGDDPPTFFWGCMTLHEMLRLSIDAFRQRIGEVAAIEPVRDRVVQLHLDSIRYSQPNPQLNDIVAANLAALTNSDMTEAIKDVRRFNAAWIKFIKKAEKYPESMTESEREKLEGEVCGICARLNSCSALNRIVVATVQIMQAVKQAEQFGHTVSVTRISRQTGERETSRNPSLHEAEAFGMRMASALPRAALEQCLEGKDFSLDPTQDNRNYYLFLKHVASRVGLIG